MTENYEKSSNKKMNITIGLILTLIVQFAGVIWWASAVNSRVGENSKLLSMGGRWTYEMALEERQRNNEVHQHLEREIKEVEGRTNNTVSEIKSAILRLEVKIDKLLKIQ